LKKNSQLDALKSGCAAVLRGGVVVCTHNTKNRDLIYYAKRRVSPKEPTCEKLERPPTAAHEECVKAGEKKAADPLGSFISAEAKRQKDALVVLFRLTAFLAKHKLSLRLYAEMVVLYQCGVDIGDTDHSRITAREMSKLISGRE
jgi:hypothetical protein